MRSSWQLRRRDREPRREPARQTTGCTAAWPPL